VDFGLSEEQQLLQHTVGQLLANENDPAQLRARFDGEAELDETFWKALMELGLGGLLVAEEYGGAGLEVLDAAVVAETLGAGAAPGPFLGHTLAGLAIRLAGSEAQKKRWLPVLATGDALGSVAFAEEGGAWQPEQWQLPGGDTLDGVKQHVPYAGLADVIVVGTAGGGLGLVEKGASGLRVEPFAGVDRTRRLATLSFDATPCQQLPVEGAAPRVRDAGLVLLAADAFGGAEHCLHLAVEYAKTREQFGVTIGHFQALKHQLANMVVGLEPARALYWYAAHAFDHVPEDSPRMAAQAKAHLTDCFMQTARDTVEAHGGIGYTWECDVQIWFKRAMFDRAFLGTPATHRERLVDWY